METFTNHILQVVTFSALYFHSVAKESLLKHHKFFYLLCVIFQ